jgi:hypothetical protein
MFTIESQEYTEDLLWPMKQDKQKICCAQWSKLAEDSDGGCNLKKDAGMVMG